MEKEFGHEHKEVFVGIGNKKIVGAQKEIAPDGAYAKISIFYKGDDGVTTRTKKTFWERRNEKITDIKVEHGPDGDYVTVTVCYEHWDEMFPIIDPSKLKGNEILDFEPETELQKELKDDILEGLNLPAFRTSAVDASVENGKIVFKRGAEPAVGHPASWWDGNFKELFPEKNSGLCNQLERAVYLGSIMKILVEEWGYSVKEAWNEVCVDSRNVGHYRTCEDARHDFELTGSRRVGPFYDLANTCKIIKDSKTSMYVIVGGYFGHSSRTCPLASKFIIDPRFPGENFHCFHSVGMFRMDV